MTLMLWLLRRRPVVLLVTALLVAAAAMRALHALPAVPAAVDWRRIAWLSMGVLRTTPDLKRTMRSRFPRSRLATGEQVLCSDGKLRYFQPLRVAMYRKMLNWIRRGAPTVKVYLCMESKEVWQQVFGFAPTGSDRSPGIWIEPAGARLYWRYDPGDTGPGYLGTTGIYGTPFTAGTWYRVRGVKAGANFKVYVNEVLVASVTVANPKTSGPAAIQFGGADVTIRNFTIYQGTWPPLTVSYADTTAGATTAYSYRVRAANTSVPWDSGYSAAASATTPTPVAPGLFTVAAATDTGIDLSWGDQNNDESGVKVERCTGAGCGNFTEIQTLPANAVTFNDTGLAPSTTYCYRARAYKSAANGWYTAYSPIACAVTISAHPTSLTATPLNSLKIRLDWTDNASDEGGYEVETLLWSGKWARTATVGADVHSYTDSVGIEPQKSYTYRVRAYRGTLKSPYSNEAAATTPAYVEGDHTCNYQVTVTASGPGSATVSPAGVACGAGCNAYCAGVQVTVTAVAGTGSSFTGWSGDCGGLAQSCTLNVDGDKSVGAGFQ